MEQTQKNGKIVPPNKRYLSMNLAKKLIASIRRDIGTPTNPAPLKQLMVEITLVDNWDNVMKVRMVGVPPMDVSDVWYNGKVINVFTQDDIDGLFRDA